ncbi:MAG: MFS transporter [Gemmatimonadales bacterium]
MSFAGTMITTVALPYQIYQRTHSTLAVGLLGAVELVPLLVMALLGGAFADAHDRRRMLLVSELALATCSAALVALSLLPAAPIWALYGIASVSAGLSGFQRPALEALTPRLLRSELMPAAAALQSFGRTLGAVGGPALGGVLIAGLGLPLTYAIDCASFVVCLVAVWQIRAVPPPPDAEPPSLARILEGLRYARRRPDLMGTYLIDINAMFFGMPMALFPAIAEKLGGTSTIGLLYAAPAFGAMLVALTSGWTARVHRHGRAIALAAAAWGLAIIGFGFADALWPALLCVVLAGAFDMISGIFRMTMWNQTIPDGLRGRLAGIEQVSYMTGPLLGNVEAGFVAGLTSLRFSVVSGGVMCVVGTAALCALLPAFLRYDDRTSVHRADKRAEEAARASVPLPGG